MAKQIEPCTWEKIDGRWICMAKHCPHWSKDGCKLGKVTLVCDNWDCRWNDDRFGRCKTMAVHLDADGKCMGMEHEP